MGQALYLLKSLMVTISALAFGVLTVATPAVADLDSDESVLLSGSHSEQQFVAGEEVRIDAAVADDIFAAGFHVVFDGASATNMFALGHRVEFTGTRAHDVVAGGGEVDFSGEVTDDLVVFACPICPMAGRRVHLGPEAVVGDDARLAGEEINIEGRIGGDLYAAGKHILLSGEVAGDVNLLAERIVLAPGARIGGSLLYRSGTEPEIAAEAVIGGETRRLEKEELDQEFMTWPVPGLGQWDEEAMARPVAGLWVRVVLVLGLIVLGTVLQLVTPSLVHAAEVTVGERPWLSLALGFALIIATPVAAALLFVTVIGIPLALVVLAVFAASLGFSMVTIAYWLGDRLRRLVLRAAEAPTGLRRWLWMAVGFIVLGLAGAIPVIGGLALLVAVLFGLGAFAGQAWPHFRAPAPAAAGA